MQNGAQVASFFAIGLHAIGQIEPGLFRRLMAAGAAMQVTGETALTAEGAAPGRLRFVVSGPILLRKGGMEIALAGPCCIGEVAWLPGVPASRQRGGPAGRGGGRWPRGDALSPGRPGWKPRATR